MTLHRDYEDERYVRMRAKYPGECFECEDDILEGDDMIWDTKDFKAYCTDCGEQLL